MQLTLFFLGNIVRTWCIGLAMAAGLSGPAVAEAGLSAVDTQRWDAPAAAVSVSDDPAAPYVAYFTPPYRTSRATDLAWSMMATRWRETGDVQLSIGVRIVHDGTAWAIAGWRLADPSFPPRRPAGVMKIEALKPLETCTAARCQTYEAASFALPLKALEEAVRNPDNTLQISILTQAGETPSIQFPPAILAELSRALSGRQASLAQP